MSHILNFATGTTAQVSGLFTLNEARAMADAVPGDCFVVSFDLDRTGHFVRQLLVNQVEVRGWGSKPRDLALGVLETVEGDGAALLTSLLGRTIDVQIERYDRRARLVHSSTHAVRLDPSSVVEPLDANTNAPLLYRALLRAA